MGSIPENTHSEKVMGWNQVNTHIDKKMYAVLCNVNGFGLKHLPMQITMTASASEILQMKKSVAVVMSRRCTCEYWSSHVCVLIRKSRACLSAGVKKTLLKVWLFICCGFQMHSKCQAYLDTPLTSTSFSSLCSLLSRKFCSVHFTKSSVLWPCQWSGSWMKAGRGWWTYESLTREDHSTAGPGKILARR